MQNKGFTLIELLVVIAIIGILAGIIVVSMGGAQNSAQDAKIKATLDQMRSSAELYKIKANVETYTGFSGTSDYTNLHGSVNSISANSGIVLNGAANKWCYKVNLLTSGAGTWCVDSAGFAGPAVTDGCGTTNAACRTAD